MNNNVCKWCGKEWKNALSRAKHEYFCKLNPDYEIHNSQNNEFIKKAVQKFVESTKKRAAANPLNQIEEYELVCKKCGKPYKLSLTVRNFSKGNYPKFCSRKCANSRCHSEEVKSKIKAGVSSFFSEHKESAQKRYKTIPKYCIVCGIELPFERRKRKTCGSKECFLAICSKAGKNGGRVSASVRVKRSKNEIEFANLCISTFKDCEITTNEPFFNGWDADVILKDYKVAVLWNGVWHYKQVRKNQSLMQIQNRDALKLKFINEAGFTPYIIKDMGSYSSDKVKQEFEDFKKFLMEERQIKI